jgi:hypothetical protein
VSTAKLQDLTIDEFLRYIVSGGVFSVVFLKDAGLVSLPPDSVEGTQLTLFFGASAMIGMILYSFHRAVTYPLVLSPLSMRLGRWLCKNPEVKKKSACSLLYELEMARLYSSEEKEEQFRQWASQIHMLYSCALAVFLGNLFAFLVILPNHVRLSWPHLVSILMLLAAGIASDSRARRYQIENASVTARRRFSENKKSD